MTIEPSFCGFSFSVVFLIFFPRVDLFEWRYLLREAFLLIL